MGLSARLPQIVAHAWRVRNARAAVFAMLDSAAIGPLRTFWEKEAPRHVEKFVERTGNIVRLDGCQLDVSSTTFSTFQRGCLWLSRHEEPERMAVARYLDPDLPVIELGASTDVLSCLISRRLRQPKPGARRNVPDTLPDAGRFGRTSAAGTLWPGALG